MTKYDPKRKSVMDEKLAQRRTAAAQEKEIRQKVRQDQLARLREAQDKANGRTGNKYHNQKTTRLIDGKRVLFDSKREAYRWDELTVLQRAGHITDLERQKRYRLIPAQHDMQGNVIEKPCDYVADFVYRKDGRVVVEDAKGRRTPDYIIKRKLMLQVYGIRVVEV